MNEIKNNRRNKMNSDKSRKERKRTIKQTLKTCNRLSAHEEYEISQATRGEYFPID